MKNIKKLMLFVVAILASFMFYGNVNASSIYNIPSNFVKINNPAVNQKYYKGELINYNLTIINQWANYKAKPVVGLTDKNLEKEIRVKDFNFINKGSKVNLKSSFTTSNIKTGDYIFVAGTIPFDDNGKEVNDYDDSDIFATKVIKIKKLKAPTKVKAKGKKKAIKISYKKAAGATQYYIYRSKKAKKGYKLIAKTKKTSYTNKKLKKGKRYYYKVKSVRNVNGSISSSYSKKVSGVTK